MFLLELFIRSVHLSGFWFSDPNLLSSSPIFMAFNMFSVFSSSPDYMFSLIICFKMFSVLLEHMFQYLCDSIYSLIAYSQFLDSICSICFNMFSQKRFFICKWFFFFLFDSFLSLGYGWALFEFLIFGDYIALWQCLGL